MDLRGARTRTSEENEKSQGAGPVDRLGVRYPCFLTLTLKYSRLASALCLRDLHARGGTREDIEGALEIMPFVRIVFFESI